MQFLDSSIYSNTKIDFMANNLNYLINTEKLKTVLIYSDLKGEGKSSFIASIMPRLSDLFSKRILILEMTDLSNDSLQESLEMRKGTNEFVQNTKFKNIDIMLIDNNDLNNIVTQEVSDFYDLILINSKNKNSDNVINEIPKIKIDGAIAIRTAKTLGSKALNNTNLLRDKDIPIVGFVLNEVKNV